MLTENQDITTPEYWNKIYLGQNDNARVDASNTKRPAATFDRFNWVAMYAEGPNVLGVASGHAHIEKRIKAAHKSWHVVASDQAEAAVDVARFEPYWIIDVMRRDLPFVCDYDHTSEEWHLTGDKWNTVIIAQALEYLADDRFFVFKCSLVSRCLIACLPLGNMEKWSQLRIYTEESARALFAEFGTIDAMDRKGDLLLIKTRFYA